jgi:hypothetical protein
MKKIKIKMKNKKIEKIKHDKNKCKFKIKIQINNYLVTYGKSLSLINQIEHFLAQLILVFNLVIKQVLDNSDMEECLVLRNLLQKVPLLVSKTTTDTHYIKQGYIYPCLFYLLSCFLNLRPEK